jgi:pterin-4a-carbinolamine dehydratase
MDDKPILPFTFFVSYRREMLPIALLLKREIEKRLQFVRVSVDVEEVVVGDHFPDRLMRLIDESHAIIALIDKGWMPPSDGPSIGGKKRDWVADELTHCRKSPIPSRIPNLPGVGDREVIPIFVDCPKDFNQFQLPSSLDFLMNIQCHFISFDSWSYSIVPLLNTIADKFKIELRPDELPFPNADPTKAKTQAISDAELFNILKYREYGGWYLDNFGVADVRHLVKTFEFRDFEEAADFMKIVSDHCRILDHHPDWQNVYKSVKVSLATWDAKNKITIFDLSLALFMNKVAETVSRRH